MSQSAPSYQPDITTVYKKTFWNKESQDQSFKHEEDAFISLRRRVTFIEPLYQEVIALKRKINKGEKIQSVQTKFLDRYDEDLTNWHDARTAAMWLDQQLNDPEQTEKKIQDLHTNLAILFNLREKLLAEGAKAKFNSLLQKLRNWCPAYDFLHEYGDQLEAISTEPYFKLTIHDNFRKSYLKQELSFHHNTKSLLEWIVRDKLAMEIFVLYSGKKAEHPLDILKLLASKYGAIALIQKRFLWPNKAIGQLWEAADSAADDTLKLSHPTLEILLQRTTQLFDLQTNALINCVTTVIEKPSDKQLSKFIDNLIPSKRILEKTRAPIGIAFSGGGIRSATFNLGFVQGLSETGILPWADYLSSISGGGYTAATLTSLTTKRGEFGPHWEHFPFNPNLEIFRKEDDGKIQSSTKPGHNIQLQHMRNYGNFIIPRLGTATADTIGLVGNTLSSFFYPLVIFLLFILTIASFHYGLTAILAPSILRNAVLPTKPLADESIPINELILLEQEELAIVARSLLPTPTVIAQTGATANEGGKTSKTLATSTPAASEASQQIEIAFEFDELKDLEIVARNNLVAEPLSYLELVIDSMNLEDSETIRLYLGLLGWGSFFAIVTVSIGTNRYLKRYVPKFTEPDSVPLNLTDEYETRKKIRRSVTGIALAITLLVLLSYKIYLSNYDWEIYWVWTPLFITLGATIGLLIFRFFPLPYKFSETVWSKGSYRALFASLQGLNIYAVLTIFILTLLILPHFYDPKPEILSTLANTAGFTFPTSAALLTLLGNLLLNYTSKQEKTTSQDEEQNRLAVWTQRLLTLSAGVQKLLLALLVVLFVLSLIFLYQARLDSYLSQSTYRTNHFFLGMFFIFTIFIGLFVLYHTYWNIRRPFRLGAVIIGIFGILYFVCLRWPEGIIINLFSFTSSLLTQNPLYVVGLLTFFAGAYVLILGQIINFNYVSFHYFYRDRMANTYLVTHLGTDPIEDARFDSRLRVAQMNPTGSSMPYHLINGAINLTNSADLRFKDRKSQHFLFSKFYSGSEVTGYVKSNLYRGGRTKLARAVAISGAAASSSVGYVTFFAQAFISTIFNLRLGLWMINPKTYKELSRNNRKLKSLIERSQNMFNKSVQVDWKLLNSHTDNHKKFTHLLEKLILKYSNANKAIRNDLQEFKNEYKNSRQLENQLKSLKFERKNSWLPYLWHELIGSISERKPLVNLSDGGHTGDNASLYMLFQRRCEIIFAGDASGDGGYKFHDLFHVLLQVKADFNIEVDIDVSGLRPNEKGISAFRCAVGEITYPYVNKQNPEMKGYLLYFKPTLTGDEPSALTEYRKQHEKGFPHVSTTDLFFNERQFEAYREIGYQSIRLTKNNLSAFYRKEIEKLTADIAKMASNLQRREVNVEDIYPLDRDAWFEFLFKEAVQESDSLDKLNKLRTTLETVKEKHKIIKNLDKRNGFGGYLSGILQDLRMATTPPKTKDGEKKS